VFVEGRVSGLGGPAVGWPANAPRVREALSMLERVERVGEGGGEGAALGADAVEVRLVLSDGSERLLRVSPGSVGGNVAAEGPGGSGMVERGAVSAFLDEGPREWRLRDAMPGVGPATTSRVTLVDEDAGRLAFDKLEGRWFVRTPVSSRADSEAVSGLLSALGSLRVIRFLDEAHRVPAEDALTVVAERDRRTVEGERVDVETERVTAVIGGASSFGPATRTARVTLSDGSRHAVAVSVESLPRGPGLLDVSGYLAPRPTAARAEDVHIVAVQASDGAGERGYRRRVEGWGEMRSDGGVVAAGPAEVERVEAALRALTAGRASATPVAEAGALRLPGRVELRDVSGGVLDVLRVGYDGEDRVAVRNGPVVWRYGDDGPRDLIALIGLGEPASIGVGSERSDPAPTGGDDGGGFGGGK
jgi:hypothetical protein